MRDRIEKNKNKTTEHSCNHHHPPQKIPTKTTRKIKNNSPDFKNIFWAVFNKETIKQRLASQQSIYKDNFLKAFQKYLPVSNSKDSGYCSSGAGIRNVSQKPSQY